MLPTPEIKSLEELRVPHPVGAWLSTIGYLVVVIFLAVSSYNLLHIRSIPVSSGVASILWPSLVILVVLSNIRYEGGVRQYAVNRLGPYSRYHFVRAIPASNKAEGIFIGYSIFGWDFSYLQIKTDAIVSLDWQSGQATAMKGCDMNDWHVALWYQHPKGPQRKPFPGVRDEEIFIIGPSGPKRTIAAFGEQVVEFLLHVGVELTPGKDNCEFVTHSRRTAIRDAGHEHDREFDGWGTNPKQP